MSHFLDRLTYFTHPRESFSGDHGVDDHRRPQVGRRLPQPLAP
jgi:hypothetical protein